MKMLILFLVLSSQLKAQVYYGDLEAWRNVSTDAFANHSFWKNLPVLKSKDSAGTEKWIFLNSQASTMAKECIVLVDNKLQYFKSECQFTHNKCLKGLKAGFITEKQFEDYVQCSEALGGCNNLFIVDHNTVRAYQPFGYCLTDKMLRPDPKFKSDLR